METPVITDTVSHYTVLNKLGAGGRGEVYLAEDTAPNRRVAIKFLPADSVADQQGKRHLIREAPAAVRLNHPNICTIHEVGEEAGRSFIVMQYVEGEIQSLLHTAKRLRPEAQGCLNPGSGYFESNNPERVATADATALRLNQLSIDPPRVAAAATLGCEAQPLRGKEFKIRSSSNKQQFCFPLADNT